MCKNIKDSKKEMTNNRFRSTSHITRIPKNNILNKNISKYKEYDYYRLFRALRYIIFLFHICLNQLH